MRRVSLFVACALLGSLSTRVPAEKATSAEVLDLLEASLAAGEGIPARVLLQRYLEHYPRTSRVIELEVLAEFYAGDYERRPTASPSWEKILVQRRTWASSRTSS